MKVVEVKNGYEFLSKLKLNKLSKELRSSVLKTFVELSIAVKGIDEKIEHLRNTMFEESELATLQDAILNNKEISKELLDKNNEFNDVILKLLEDDCDVKIVKIPEEKFIDCLVDSEVEFTPADILRLKPILK